MPGSRPLACLLALLLFPAAASGQARLPAAPTDGDDDPQATPAQLRSVEVEQRIGNVVPLDAPLFDADGNAVTLGDLFTDAGGEPVPVLLNLGYYDCPLSCAPIRRGIAEAARQADPLPGEDYRIVSVSINPDEGPDVANLYRNRTLKRLGRDEGGEGRWVFLTGPESSVRPIAGAVGFGYKYLPAQDLIGHGNYITFLSPGDGEDTARGTVTSYLNGITYRPQQFELAIRDASEGSLGSPFDGLIAWCYQFSGEHGQYVIVARRVMAIAGAVIAMILAGVIFFLFRWERARHTRLRAEEAERASGTATPATDP